MVYTTNIPLANDLISNSQAQILGNFQFMGSTTGNVASPGFYRFPNGLIIQWGHIAFTTSGTKTGTFAVAFTAACFNVTFSVAYDSSATAVVPICIDRTTTPASLVDAKFRVNASPAAPGDIYWIAIGV
jgi:hypothetical protein